MLCANWYSTRSRAQAHIGTQKSFGFGPLGTQESSGFTPKYPCAPGHHLRKKRKMSCTRPASQTYVEHSFNLFDKREFSPDHVCGLLNKPYPSFAIPVGWREARETFRSKLYVEGRSPDPLVQSTSVGPWVEFVASHVRNWDRHFL